MSAAINAIGKAITDHQAEKEAAAAPETAATTN
jgi:hypothetical protein